MEDMRPNSSAIQMDTTVCRGCQACVLACSLHHEGECSPNLSRVAVVKDMRRHEFGIFLCRHCNDPACVDACPSGALSVDGHGWVLLHEDDCTRCGSCVEACPHDAIFHNRNQDRYLKCDMCASREASPVCVAVCPSKALGLPGGSSAKGGSL